MKHSAINSHNKTLKEFFQENREFLLALFVLWLIIIILLINSLILTRGHLVYTLDDAYIHMAIAKNFSQYGIWGVTRYEFSSSSSSILFTLILSLLYLIFGPNEIAPFIVNLIFANILLYVVYFILKKKNVPSYAIIVCLLSIIFFLPLHSLIFTGMEHTLQVLINLVFVFLVSEIISDNYVHQRKFFSIQNNLLYFLTPLVTMIRFEGMFLIIVVSFLFLLRKMFYYALFIGILGFLPITIYGIISISYGWYFFPNSILIKGGIPEFSKPKDVFNHFNPIIIINFPHLQILLTGAFIIFYVQSIKNKEVWNKLSIMAFIFISITIFQLYFASVGFRGIYSSRYDAHIVALGLILIFISIKNRIPQHLSIDYFKLYYLKIKENSENSFFQIIALALVLIFFFTPFIYRSSSTLEGVPQATNNIYEQQYQMGLFLEKYYSGECIAANDIGAINYLADIECLDLRGLCSSDIARSIMNDDLDEDVIYKIAKKKDCKIAIIYEDAENWFDVPTQWIKVGEWTIKHNVVCYFDTVSFWAVDPDEVDNLIEHLEDYSKYLPNTVSESGNYTK